MFVFVPGKALLKPIFAGALPELPFSTQRVRELHILFGEGSQAEVPCLEPELRAVWCGRSLT